MTPPSPPATGRPPVKTVQVTHETYVRLYHERQPGETFDDVVRRLFGAHEIISGLSDEELDELMEHLATTHHAHVAP